MENASKALLMAAGVLIAIVTISALILTHNRLSEVSQMEQDKLRTEQLLEFNQEYESYNRKDLYGAQMISIMNQIIDNNEKYRRLEEPNYEIEMVVKFTVKDGYFNSKKEGTTYATVASFQTKVKQANSDQTTLLKRKLFKCTGIDYNKDTGRVNKLSFEEIDITDSKYQVNGRK